MRFLWFSILLVTALTLPWELFIIGVLFYAFAYEGVELLPLAFFLDAFSGRSVPWLPFEAIYVLATLGILLFVWGMKPLFLIESRIE